MSVEKTKMKKYVLVAPDGGWGYMICVGVILNMISITSFLTCFGVIYKELFIQLKMDSTSVTLYNGVACLVVSLSGLMNNVLLKYLSFRKLGLIAALIYNIGMFGTAFTTSKFHFFLFQGVIQSIGHGIIINLTFTVLNNYFVIKRLFAVSLAQTVAAAFGFVTPGLVKWAIEVYGFRGCILLITGVCMHTIFAMMLMQPVEWHMKKVEVFEYPEGMIFTSLLSKEDLTDDLIKVNFLTNPFT
ncbi:monocarboxylate transporter 13 [Bicyclus anynana]|uniref:Monocarboxylate transporter 13 n=1 Tax=Bicyclus anynana TaxID=110368 RepID=A0ABM3LIU8_BICAN|nr:monocarboxylate transporter 13 [Bicyclus anynana]